MIDLTHFKCQAGSPRLLDAGGEQAPIGLGVTQRLGRRGSRYSIEYTVPADRIEPNGRIMIADLQMAKLQGARVEFPQVDFNIGSPGFATIAGATAAGMTLPVTGCQSGYAVAKGQAFNVIKAGRRYLYFASARVVLDATGAGSIPLTIPLRTILAGGEAIDWTPCIEGWISGDELSWTLETARTVGLSFTVTERA